jgi:hypothetical protein
VAKCRKILEKGWDPSQVDEAGMTPLHVAAMKGNGAIVSILIRRHNCPLNVETPNGKTALDLAAQGGHVECVDSLLRYGAGLLSSRSSNESSCACKSLVVAAMGGHKAVCVLILATLNQNLGRDRLSMMSLPSEVMHVLKAWQLIDVLSFETTQTSRWRVRDGISPSSSSQSWAERQEKWARLQTAGAALASTSTQETSSATAIDAFLSLTSTTNRDDAKRLLHKYGNVEQAVNGFFDSKSPEVVVVRTGGHAIVFTMEELQKATLNFDSRPLHEGGRKIGSGGFGVVVQGFLMDSSNTRQAIAVKRLTQDVSIGEQAGLSAVSQFRAELSLLKRATHTNIVKLVGYCQPSSFHGDSPLNSACCIVLEYCEMGSLEKLLSVPDPDPEHLTWGSRMKIASDVADGLHYLHTVLKTIHRDMACANILLTRSSLRPTTGERMSRDDVEGSTITAKISDFGLSVAAAATPKAGHCDIVGTLRYLAPEYQTSGLLTTAADVYAFGIVLLELISSASQALQINGNELRMLVSSIEQLNISVAANGASLLYFNQMKRVVSQCVKRNHIERPSSTSLVSTIGSLFARFKQDEEATRQIAQSSSSQAPLIDLMPFETSTCSSSVFESEKANSGLDLMSFGSQVSDQVVSFCFGSQVSASPLGQSNGSAHVSRNMLTAGSVRPSPSLDVPFLPSPSSFGTAVPKQNPHQFPPMMLLHSSHVFPDLSQGQTQHGYGYPPPAHSLPASSSNSRSIHHMAAANNGVVAALHSSPSSLHQTAPSTTISDDGVANMHNAHLHRRSTAQNGVGQAALTHSFSNMSFTKTAPVNGIGGPSQNFGASGYFDDLAMIDFSVPT